MGVSPFNSFYNEGPTSATFIVEVDGKILGSFREVRGLGGKVEIFEVTEGGENGFVHKLPGRFTFDDVTLKRGMTFDNGLYNWFNEASGSRFELGSKRGKATLARQNVAITLMSAKGKRLRTWILTDAIPVSWKGPELSIETDEFLVEEITLAHHGLVSTNMGLPAGASKKPNIKAAIKKSNNQKPGKKPGSQKANIDSLNGILKLAKDVVNITKDATDAAEAIKDLTKAVTPKKKKK